MLNSEKFTSDYDEVLLTSQALAHRLSEYASSLTYEDIPADVIHDAKRLTLGTLGCAIAAYD